MKLLRSNIDVLNKLTIGSFVFSWLMLVIAIPAQIVAMAGSHTIFSVYNAEEGCYELVMNHHKDAEGAHLSDVEEHDIHSFHSSCCYDEFLVKLKKQDTQQDAPIANILFETSPSSFHKQSESFYLENNLPPPLVTLEVIRVTRLLI